jgi:hypothetical protein
MIDYLDLAQDYLDSDQTVPDKILMHMSNRERQIFNKMMELKNQLGKDIDNSLPKNSLHLLDKHSSRQNKFRPNFKFLYAAAAMLIVVTYIPINRSIETKNLLLEDSSIFVDQLFQGEIDSHSYILADMGLDKDLFYEESILEF